MILHRCVKIQNLFSTHGKISQLDELVVKETTQNYNILLKALNAFCISRAFPTVNFFLIPCILDLIFSVRTRACEKRITGKQPW